MSHIIKRMETPRVVLRRYRIEGLKIEKNELNEPKTKDLKMEKDFIEINII